MKKGGPIGRFGSSKTMSPSKFGGTEGPPLMHRVGSIGTYF
jgi:hypothetical protein